MVLLVVVSAGLAVGAAERVRAGGPSPSPFAGHYATGGPCWITISSNGSIRGSSDGFFDSNLRGSISATGEIVFTYDTTLGTGNWDGDAHGGRKHPSKITWTVTGLAALDDEGNLYGVAVWDSVLGTYTGQFLWTRCD
jgi:hypothetical protein